MNTGSLIVRNILRSPRNFLFSSAGLILGITTFILFLGVGSGLRENVLRRVFVVDQIEVSPARGGLLGPGAPLTDREVSAIADLDDVVAVYPRQQLAFPSYVVGGEALLGTDLWSELIADGVPPELIRADLGQEERDPFAFTDWEETGSCSENLPCPPSHVCSGGRCEAVACTPPDEIWAFADRGAAAAHLERTRSAAGRSGRVEIRDAGDDVEHRFRIAVTAGNPDAAQRALRAARPGGEELDPEDAGCPVAPAWCHRERRECAMPVPVVVSTQLLELYNSNVQSVLSGSGGRLRNLPRLTAEGLQGFQFDALLGRSFVGAAERVEAGEAGTERLRMHIVGFTPRAIPLGATIPIGYVTRWNATYRPDRGDGQVDSLLVVVRYSEDLQRVARTLEQEFGLQPDPRYEMAQRASLMVAVLIGVMVGLSLLIVGLAALNIMNTLLMIIAERQREIGVLRALGATRGQLHVLVMGEAAVLAVASTLLSWVLAVGLMHGIDAGFTAFTADFPFKPESLFRIDPLLPPASLALALAFCTLGAWLPARRAARLDPAVAFRTD
ncbi:MAG: FtsX-like permease family protein [Deltaproteobacteria bacterium]|nr:MAG: FtsX-like permease family protein [Deltaproteobacteria bacterium]